MPTDPVTPSTAPSKASRRAAAKAAQAAARARARRRRRVLKAVGIVSAVVVIIAAIVAIGLLRKSHTTSTTVAADAVITKVSSVPPDTFDKVGAGTVQMRPKAITGAPALTADGKPRVVYVGAEYCPFCAAQRWAVVAALARFGTFSNLGQTTSSADDIYPNTPTLSFHGATYTSEYLSFTGTELQSNQRVGNSYAPLDTLTPADQKLLDTYDTQQYTGSSSGSIPFLDLGGRYVSAGASYSPQLFAGLDQQQVADQLADPTSPIAKAVDGTANVITSQLCQLTDNKPADVCTSSAVTAAR